MKSLLAAGHEVHVLAPQDDSVIALEEMGCTFTPLRMDRNGMNPFAELALRRRIGLHFDEISPEIVLGFTIKNNVFGAMAAGARNIPFIPNVTGLGTAFQLDGILKTGSIALYRFAFRKCPIVFFQNSNDRDIFLRAKIVDLQKTRLLPGSGIDLEAFQPAPVSGRSNELVFLMVSRLLRDKGVAEYAEAARMLRKKLPGTRFQLLGEADSANRTAISLDQVKRWEATHNIEYLGTSNDVPSLLAKADCVVLPSYYPEGTPRSLIEAAAMARPVITTDMPGCRAVIDDGRSGMLCKPRDPEDLARKMEAFAASSSASRAEMGLVGRAKMEREFDVSLVVDAYRDAMEVSLAS